jgi:hypothetical protein
MKGSDALDSECSRLKALAWAPIFFSGEQLEASGGDNALSPLPLSVPPSFISA